MPQGEHEEDRLSKRLSRGAPFAVLIVIVLFISYRLLFILELVAVAALLALVLRIAVDELKRLGFPLWLAVSTILAGIAAFGAFVWFVIIPNILQQFRALTSEGPDSLQQEIETVISKGTDFLGSLPFIPDDFASQLLQRLDGVLTGLIGSLPATLPTFASIFSTAAVGVIAVVFLAIYFAISPGTYVSSILRLVPLDRRERARMLVRRLERKMRGWVVGTIIVSFFVGVGAGIGLWIIGVPLALTFGILVGVLNVIPFLGLAIGGLFPGLLALTISPIKALLVGVLFLIIDQVDGNILRPLVFSREVEIPPGWVLVSILVLGTLLGPILGTFLAIPAAVVLSVVVEELTESEPPLEDDETEDKPSSGGSHT